MLGLKLLVRESAHANKLCVPGSMLLRVEWMETRTKMNVLLNLMESRSTVWVNALVKYVKNNIRKSKNISMNQLKLRLVC